MSGVFTYGHRVSQYILRFRARSAQSGGIVSDNAHRTMKHRYNKYANHDRFLIDGKQVDIDSVRGARNQMPKGI